MTASPVGTSLYYDIVFPSSFTNSYAVYFETDVPRGWAATNKTSTGFRADSNSSYQFSDLVSWVAEDLTSGSIGLAVGPQGPSGSGGGGATTYDSLLASTLYTIPFASTFSYNGTNGTIQSITLSSTASFTIINLTAGLYYTFFVSQDGTGGRNLGWSSSVKVAYNGSGSVPQSTTANATDKYTLFYNGSNYYIDYGLNYT
jgi:hypothetical protein